MKWVVQLTTWKFTGARGLKGLTIFNAVFISKSPQENKLHMYNSITHLSDITGEQRELR